METINFTIKLEKHQVTKFMQMVEDTTQMLEFKILPDTEKMYESDPVFRELSKLKKQGKTAVEKYINDNNNKYKNK